MKILVFRTVPDSLNSNLSVERSLSLAIRTALPDATIKRVAINAVVDLIAAFAPDLVIGVGGFVHDRVNYSAIWSAAQRSHSALVYWQLDDPYELDYNWKVDGKCSWIFTNDLASRDYYPSGRASHLPLAAGEDYFLPIKPYEERQLDVFFCGVGYPNRRELLYQLRHILSSFKTAVFGSDWDTRHAFCRNERLTSSSLAEFYANAKVVINVGRDFNIANARFEVTPSTPGPRTFEAAASGTVQAMFLDSLEIFDMFREKHEILHFSSVDEFGELVGRVVEEDGYGRGIALAAQERAHRDHRFINRARSLFAQLSAVGVIGSEVSGADDV